MNPAAAPAVSPPHKVLVVEDEAVIALETEAHMVDMGYTVVGRAASGAQALALAESAQPDLVLMDIQLAGAMDGIDTALRLRERFDIPVVFVTAYTDPEMLARGKPAQPIAWLVKPYSDRELHITVELALHRHAAERTLRETNHQLAEALASVRRLSGLLPICMHCKKIRDDADYWHGIEAYISEHSEAKFSHGFCPACFEAEQKRLDDLLPPQSPPAGS